MSRDERSTSGGIAQETGELHRLLVESVQDYAIFALDPHGYILSWNAGAQRFKGYTADEIIGKHFSIFYPEAKRREGFPEYELREAARVGRFEDEGWRIRKDGSRFWANVVITALRDASGKLIGYAKVTRDLSERRAAEEALRLSEERFRLLLESVRDYAIFMLDATGHVTTWNQGAQRINGYAGEEIIGKHFSIFYPEDKVREGFPDYELREATRTGRFEDEGWRIRKDGSRFWANVVISAVRNADGELIGFSKVTRDLTERRAAEERAIENARRAAAEEAARRTADAARARTEQLQALTSALSAAHTIPEVVNVSAQDGFRAIRADAGSLALIDRSGDHVQLVSTSGYNDLPVWAQRAPLTRDVPIVDAIRSGKLLVFETRADRNARYHDLASVLDAFESTVVVPLSSRGRIIGALAVHRREPHSFSANDVAFIRSFAQQCGQALERAQLYEAEQQARREAEEARARADEANRAKSEFLAAMSHELRTPLNAIGGYADLLKMGITGPVTPAQQEQLERIRRSQQHLLVIINDLLNFSRIEAGQIDYVFADVAVRDMFATVAPMILPQTTGKHIRFDVADVPAELTAHVDRAKAEQIILNLLSNAVKFTPAGGVVTLDARAVGQRELEVIVCDTGIGIPTDQLERIFEPFVQVGRTLTSSQEGTGLGLAISRDLARAMGGELRVTSIVGHGATFTLTLQRKAFRRR